MNELFLKKAVGTEIQIQKTTVKANGDFSAIGKDETRVFDFGNHYVGCVSVSFSLADGCFDAPFVVELFFAENKRELSEQNAIYSGSMREGWVQKERVRVYELPFVLELPARYACRYVQIKLTGVSLAYHVRIDEVCMEESTSAVGAVDCVGKTPQERRIDEVSLRTLRSCMQEVFEDGPKRDRRLWLGDLRLQALVNYETYRNYDLVKKCLYLFAGATNEDGLCKGCVFTSPNVYVPQGDMFDYPLLFIPTLLEYYENAKDEETVRELFPTAVRQLQWIGRFFDENGRLKDNENVGWVHIDWSEEVDKKACGQAVYVYAAKALQKLCAELKEDLPWLHNDIGQKSAILQGYYDESRGVFVGKDGRISYAQNAWSVLAGVFPAEENAKILKQLFDCKDAIKPVSPYMYHYYVQALCDCGLLGVAKEILLWYWGKMVEDGADTFYEVFNPDEPNQSPYGDGGVTLNSYCHAWSCTPAYFFRKYSL
ncbi:MAG: hypothetical protein IJ373_07820 [Clostridia bacterium]|nr:hypothetical protein [Clostridia bacterium]